MRRTTYVERLVAEFDYSVDQIASEAVSEGRALGHEGEDLDEFVEIYLNEGPTNAEIRMALKGL